MYPKFIEANINHPDIEIKRENMLLKLFQIKGISMYDINNIFRKWSNGDQLKYSPRG